MINIEKIIWKTGINSKQEIKIHIQILCPCINELWRKIMGYKYLNSEVKSKVNSIKRQV